MLENGKPQDIVTFAYEEVAQVGSDDCDGVDVVDSVERYEGRRAGDGRGRAQSPRRSRPRAPPDAGDSRAGRSTRRTARSRPTRSPATGSGCCCSTRARCSPRTCRRPPTPRSSGAQEKHVARRSGRRGVDRIHAADPVGLHERSRPRMRGGAARRLPSPTARRRPTSTPARWPTRRSDEHGDDRDTTDGRRQRAGARLVQQRHPAARHQDDLRRPAVDPAAQGHSVFQLGHGAQRIGQRRGIARGRERVQPREHVDQSRGLARPAGRRAGRQRAAGQPRRRGARSRAAAWRSSSRASRRSRKRCSRWPPTRAGRRSPTPTTSARRSTRSRTRSRRTTSSATRAPTRSCDGSVPQDRGAAEAEDRRAAARARGLLRRPRLHAHDKGRIARRQLQEQLLMAIPATDVPLFVTAGYFRLPNATTQCAGAAAGGGPGGGRRVWWPRRPGRRRAAGPADQAVAAIHAVRATTCRSRSPCRAKRCPLSQGRGPLDVRGFVRDERNQPFATIKHTLTVPPGDARHARVQAGAVPDGRDAAARRYIAPSIIVRENMTGQMGTFEAAVLVPDLACAGSR